MGLKNLFEEHIRILQANTEQILQELKLDGLVLGAGSTQVYFEDDQDIAFRSNHHFRHWSPLEGPHHLIVVKAGQKPHLRVFKPADFWYEVKPLAPEFWVGSFTIELFDQLDPIWKNLANPSERIAYHGPDQEQAKEAGLLVGLEGLIHRLNWNRLNKTAYEQQCLVDASRVAAEGHKAAERVFRQGGSELDIHFAYLKATRSREVDLPYENIIGLNEKGSFLHYAEKRDDVHNGRVLLIDAGACSRGYAADITRTYATDEAPEEFRALLADVGTMQQDICASIRVGVQMSDLQFDTHRRIAKLLIDHKILLNCDVDRALNDGFTQAFFPHGLGHMLGIFVHDVAGKQINREGAFGEADPRFPKLRTLRPLEVGTCVTIEPGIYFIKMLLEPFKGGAHHACFNWPLLDLLMPCGGVRIEDDVIVLADQIRNVTREFLP